MKRRMRSRRRNLCLLSLMLDFRLYEEHGALLNLPHMQSLRRLDDKRQLQVEVANAIHEFDRNNGADTIRDEYRAWVRDTGGIASMAQGAVLDRPQHSTTASWEGAPC